ncbi:DUF6973 domain-containing protein [Flavobacterium sp. RS13.1]|uniref:DUF6973 domain-containing protein n=1 Tax=Flavobacterium sp. RS13.1 TaxID=3400345 RepID=UPI003AAFE399
MEGLEAIRLTGTDGNSRLMTRPANSTLQKSASSVFAYFHPIAANAIGTIERGSTNISSVSGRIARHMTDNGNMSGGIGSESNAFRHALWSATMSTRYDEEIATKAGNAHEGGKIFDALSIDFNSPLIQNTDYADSVVDLLNNEIGRQISEGIGNDFTSQIDIARQVLNVQVTHGLWKVSTDKNGNISISRKKISERQFNASLQILNNLDRGSGSTKCSQKNYSAAQMSLTLRNFFYILIISKSLKSLPTFNLTLHTHALARILSCDAKEIH